MLKSVKCANCGANVEIEETKHKAYCEFCGSRFLVSVEPEEPPKPEPEVGNKVYPKVKVQRRPISGSFFTLALIAPYIVMMVASTSFGTAGAPMQMLPFFTALMLMSSAAIFVLPIKLIKPRRFARRCRKVLSIIQGRRSIKLEHLYDDFGKRRSFDIKSFERLLVGMIIKGYIIDYYYDFDQQMLCMI